MNDGPDLYHPEVLYPRRCPSSKTTLLRWILPSVLIVITVVVVLAIVFAHPSRYNHLDQLVNRLCNLAENLNSEFRQDCYLRLGSTYSAYKETPEFPANLVPLHIRQRLEKFREFTVRAITAFLVEMHAFSDSFRNDLDSLLATFTPEQFDDLCQRQREFTNNYQWFLDLHAKRGDFDPNSYPFLEQYFIASKKLSELISSRADAPYRDGLRLLYDALPVAERLREEFTLPSLLEYEAITNRFLSLYAQDEPVLEYLRHRKPPCFIVFKEAFQKFSVRLLKGLRNFGKGVVTIAYDHSDQMFRRILSHHDQNWNMEFKWFLDLQRRKLEYIDPTNKIFEDYHHYSFDLSLFIIKHFKPGNDFERDAVYVLTRNVQLFQTGIMTRVIYQELVRNASTLNSNSHTVHAIVAQVEDLRYRAIERFRDESISQVNDIQEVVEQLKGGFVRELAESALDRVTNWENNYGWFWNDPDGHQFIPKDNEFPATIKTAKHELIVMIHAYDFNFLMSDNPPT